VKKIEDGAGASEEDVNAKAEKGEAPNLLACKVCCKPFSSNDDLRVHWQEHLIKEEVEEEDEEEEEKLVEQTDDGTMEPAMPEEDGVQNKNTVPCVRCHKEIDKSCKQVGICCIQKDLLTNTSVYQTGSHTVDIFIGKEVSYITLLLYILYHVDGTYRVYRTTPLSCSQSFIADSTSRYYNHSITLDSDPLMSCLKAVIGRPLFSKASG
jgi:hypothetical protein